MKPLILALTLIYFFVAIGADRLPAAIYAGKDTLRPASSAIFYDRGKLFPSKTSSAGYKEELTRARQLSQILVRYPEYGPNQLLTHIKRYKPNLLDDIPDEERIDFLRSFMLLGYETKPLPAEVLDRLPGLKTSGERIIAIREARGKTPEDIVNGMAEKVKAGIARREVPINLYTYKYHEKKKKELPVHDLLWDISRELEVDPIYIIEAKGWDKATTNFIDAEKMKLHRQRRCLTAEESVHLLERAGFKFTGDNLKLKAMRVRKLESGGKMPTREETIAIRRAYYDQTLFSRIVEEQSDSAKPPADLPDGGKLKWYRVNKNRWSQKECVRRLEAAGFGFSGKTMTSKINKLKRLEEGEELSTFKNAVVIQNLFADKALFAGAVEKGEEKIPEVAPADLLDGEKMQWYRVNKKGWLLRKCVEELEKAGFKFTANKIRGKMTVLFNIEKGERVPTPDEVIVIRKVFGDKDLFADVIPSGLSEGERMERKRLYEKGWTRPECVEKLEKAGFPFKSDTKKAKVSIIYELEKGIRPPTPEKAVAIREAFDDPTLFAAEQPSKERGPTRTERLNLILEENPQLDTLEKLLEYINENESKLLDGVDKNKQIRFLRDFLFLRYETAPLPMKILKQLAGITSEGARLDLIREGRGMEVEELCKLVGIYRYAYRDMVQKKVFPRPENLINILRALQVDAIYIKKAKSWDKAAPELEDKERLFLCRFRKGWTQRVFIARLKEAGLKFESKSQRTEYNMVEGWENGEQIPDRQQRKIIREVLGESSLYEKADEKEQAEAERKIPLFEPSEEEGPRYLTGVPKTSIHTFLAEHWQELAGLTTGDIETEFGISSVSTRTFLRTNKMAAKAYGINYPVIGRKPGISSRPPAGERPPILPRPPARSKPPLSLPAAKPTEPEMTAEEAADKAAERQRTRGHIEEAEFTISKAEAICESLKSPGTRDLVEKANIEEAISELANVLNGLQSMVEAEIKTGAKTDKILMQPEARKRLIEVKEILRRLQAVAPTKLCDWDNPQIRKKATEIVKGLPTDLARKNEIVRWVDENIKVIPGRKGCWDMKASETFRISEGASFNRLNLIVAMLRSVGIFTHYKILSIKEGKGRVVEDVVPEALVCVEEIWNAAVTKTIRRYNLVALEEIDIEKVVDSRTLYDIGKFAAKKAEEERGKNPGKASPAGEHTAYLAIRHSA